MSDKIVLFDLPTKDDPPKCYSPNCWRIRALLNYKKIDYETHWTDYPDIKPTFQSFRIPPQPADHYVDYSCPAVKMPGGEHIMDSIAIAKALEEKYPEPTLHLDTPETDESQEAVLELMKAMAPPYAYRIPDMLMDKKNSEYYHKKRIELFGMDLYSLRDHEEFTSEKTWARSSRACERIRKLLDRHPQGPYVLGDRVSYSDFVLAGWWKMSSYIDVDGDFHGRLMGFDESFGKHWEACREWFGRDDH